MVWPRQSFSPKQACKSMYSRLRRCRVARRAAWSLPCRASCTTSVPQCTRWLRVRHSSASLPLRDHGLEWIHPSAPLAHPLDDGTAVISRARSGRCGDCLRRRRKSMAPIDWSVRRALGRARPRGAATGPFIYRGIPCCWRIWDWSDFPPQSRSQNIGFAAQGPRHSSPDWRHILSSRSTNR